MLNFLIPEKLKEVFSIDGFEDKKVSYGADCLNSIFLEEVTTSIQRRSSKLMTLSIYPHSYLKKFENLSSAAHFRKLPVLLLTVKGYFGFYITGTFMRSPMVRQGAIPGPST